jgi:integrase
MLSALAIDNAKPREKPYILTDGNGLHLLINPNGSKLWRLRYRFGGKQNMLSLGPFPAITLARARAKRDDARKLLAEGKDPSTQKKLDQLAQATAAANTFRAVAEEHIAALGDRKRAHRTIAKNRWLLFDLASPLLDRPIAGITPAEILTILKRREKLGQRETARRLRGAIGRVFRLAVATLRAPYDPTYSIKSALTPPTVTHRPAIVDERQLGALMVSIDEYTGWPTLKAAMQLTALTMTRPGEVRFMRRSEIVWPTATWKIPAERMKMRVAHDVPLSKQAIAVLRGIWDVSEGHQLVFPSIRSPLKPLSENAMNSVLRRLGYAKDEMCSHGFRTSASTILNERGFGADVIEVALAHQDRNQIRATYNRARYWKERIALMQAWADLLDEFRIASVSDLKAARS